MAAFRLLLGFLIMAMPITAFLSCLGESGSNFHLDERGNHVGRPSSRRLCQSTALKMAQISANEAKAGIDKVVKALQKDNAANQELGRLVSVNNVLGYGSPKPGELAVRFNASFQKGGMGRSSIPLPFGLGQTNKSEGRGTMVGQVKASIDIASGKVVDCSVFRDLGYGRAFNLKV